jgi:hypothetical protein
LASLFRNGLQKYRVASSNSNYGKQGQVLRAQGSSQIAYSNGVITSRRTFQKYYNQIDLRDLHVHDLDYDLSDSPPLLHQKDLLVAPDYPGYEKFAKLSRQEEDWGLLEDWK